jgi:hypothetical protein
VSITIFFCAFTSSCLSRDCPTTLVGLGTHQILLPGESASPGLGEWDAGLGEKVRGIWTDPVSPLSRAGPVLPAPETLCRFLLIVQPSRRSRRCSVLHPRAGSGPDDLSQVPAELGLFLRARPTLGGERLADAPAL